MNVVEDRLRPGLDPSLRLQLGLALRELPPSWPLRTFVAANPLAGMEDLSLRDALAREHEGHIARGFLPDEEYRAWFADGAISRSALAGALVRAHPWLAQVPPIGLGFGSRRTVELVIEDLAADGAAPGPGGWAGTTFPRGATLLDRVEQVHPSHAGGEIDAALARWAAAYLDPAAPWAMPHRDRGFWSAWKALVVHDPTVRRLIGRRGAASIRALPDGPDEALGALLASQPGETRAVLGAHLWHLPGWSTAMARAGQDGVDLAVADDVVGFVAARLALEAAVLARIGVDALHDATIADDEQPDGTPAADRRAALVQRASAAAARLGAETPSPDSLALAADVLERVEACGAALIWQEALETTTRDRFLLQLSASRPEAGRVAPPAAHVVLCIDPRSEGLRRHLEAVGDYATIGFAGFFGLPLRIHRDGAAAPEPSCPVLVDPRGVVRETDQFDPNRIRRATRTDRRERARSGLHDAKVAPLSAFALAEAGGWVSGTTTALRTVRPRAWRRLRHRFEQTIAAGVTTHMDVDGVSRAGGVALEDQVVLAESILRTMGLTHAFSPLIVLCGHGSHHTNNPFRAANDCGACGGRSGGVNARIAADILNHRVVRDRLASRGITIPHDTWFVAAEHDTAADTFQFFDDDRAPLSSRDALAHVRRDLTEAGSALARERCGELPGAPTDPTPAEAARHVQERAADWAQAVPEWGLMGNHALVIGPRWLTAGHDLARRAFLHDYDDRADGDGAVLTTILTGPMVVAHWICSQYRFSTTDPEVFGAGTKPLHNVVAGLGVLQGAGGDLRVGLPLESVRWRGEPLHRPGRLLVVVHAPQPLIDGVIAANPVLQRLVGGGWIRLVARAAPERPWAERDPEGPWTDLDIPRAGAPADRGRPAGTHATATASFRGSTTKTKEDV